MTCLPERDVVQRRGARAASPRGEKRLREEVSRSSCTSESHPVREREDGAPRAFDAAAKERALQAEAAAWAAPTVSSSIPVATEEDIPTVDLARLRDDPESVAEALRSACLEVGFLCVVNHGVSDEMLRRGERAVGEFVGLPLDAKARCTMDAVGADYPTGTGYLPVNNFKLPKRSKGNLVEAFIVKRELGPRNITLDKMPWPEELGPAWRSEVEAYANAMEELSLRMLPAYSLALGEEADYLSSAFKSPLWRLRLQRYPAQTEYEEGQYGIAPHVDTSFITVLHRNETQPCLVVWSARSERWVRLPSRPGQLVVNSGELLRQVSNDTFLAARHYVLNEGRDERTSLAFFFNATADFKVSVAPGAGGGAPRYPPTSYLDGQGVVQGE